MQNFAVMFLGVHTEFCILSSDLLNEDYMGFNIEFVGFSFEEFYVVLQIYQLN
jgi:hypothetical protein